MEETKNTVELSDSLDVSQDGPARRSEDEARLRSGELRRSEGGNNKEEDTLPEEAGDGEEAAFTSEEEELFREMMETGVFYGRSKARTNPLMKDYVLTTRAGFEVIDLKRTIVALADALNFIKRTVVKDKGPILLVGTSPAAKAIVKETARSLDLPAVTERWLGGTLTNFKVIAERINQFKKLKSDIAAGKFEKHTKKERLELDRELARSEILFGGIEKLDRLPSLIIITDLVQNTLAAKEAQRTGIPVLAFVNTDADPRLVNHVIPANDKNPKSIKLLLDYLAKAIEEIKTVAPGE
ncbi:MAG: 30S ribosomal protein S2 [Candidatus Colwellbacteria bacterium]|nr:30S ribosomal protein S2 [Candidatus Colwellbacteria bacterium]